MNITPHLDFTGVAGTLIIIFTLFRVKYMSAPQSGK